VIEFRVLGPLEARRAGRPIPLGGPKQRALLAYLLLRANEPVPADELVEALWPRHHAEDARKALRVAVSRLRAALGTETTLATRAAGYELLVSDEQLDLHRFRALAAEGERSLRAGDWAAAAARCEEALASWRGSALADVRNDGLGPDADRLEEFRVHTIEQRVEAELALGRHSALVGDLDELVERHPYRERLRRQHMLALYRSGRQAEALASYRSARRRLVDELGIEPGPELQELERAILRQDPELAPPAVGTTAPAAANGRRRRQTALVAAGALALAAVAAGATLTLVDGTSSRPAAATLAARTNSLLVVDERSGRAIRNIPLGGSPTELAAGAGALWVLLAPSAVVVRVDPARSTRTPIGVPPDPIGITAGPGGVWVADRWNTITRIDPATATADPPTRLARERVFPNEIADVTTTRGSVWLASRDSAESARYSLRSGRVRTGLGSGGGDGAFFYGAGTSVIGSGFGDVWLTNRVDVSGELPSIAHTGRLTRIAADSGAVLGRFALTSAPRALAATRDAIWIAGDDRVWRLGRNDPLPSRDVRVPAGPIGLAADASGAWVVSRDRRLLHVDAAGNRIIERWRLDREPTAVGVGFGRVWVTVGRPKRAAA
jgi:DNA-binding SARP family transcriptional activator